MRLRENGWRRFTVAAALCAGLLAPNALAAEASMASLQLDTSSLAFFSPHARPSESERPLKVGWLAPSVFDELSAEGVAFADQESVAGGGGGGGAGPIAALAFVLGVIPGFGLGHLVAGSIYGFVGYLCVDVVIGIVLYWILPIVIFPAYPYMFALSTLALIVERVIEGYGAFRTAEYHGADYAKVDDPASATSELAKKPPRFAPNLASLPF